MTSEGWNVLDGREVIDGSISWGWRRAHGQEHTGDLETGVN